MSTGILRTDGGSRGNPGPAGAGFVIEGGGEVICSGGRYLGSQTNNVAEYQALIWGLENALALGFSALRVFADSELLVKQLNGQYRVKSPQLKPLFSRALELSRHFDAFEVTHVYREDNELADEMANQAMDERATVGNPKCDPGGSTQQKSLF
jgi:ribonuclease HI